MQPLVSLFQKPRLSKVNARHLLDDLASSYSHALDETVLVELVANALDAGASEIAIELDGRRKRFTVQDDGVGMTGDEFVRYHDLAESRKQRGAGIGFAGLGAKLAHRIAKKVATESRRGENHNASEWRWQGDDLEWKHVRARQLAADGTRVTLELARGGSHLAGPDFVESTLRRFYGPLLDPELATFYVWESIYPKGVSFSINGEEIPKRPLVDPGDAAHVDYVDIKDRRKRRIGRAVFAVMKSPLPESERGIGLTTHGKLIRRDGLGLNPRTPELVTGWAEVPGLVECLTLNKQDFLNHGSVGERYHRMRRAVQTAYDGWLSKVGQHRVSQDSKRAPRNLERELQEIIRKVPELQYLFGAAARLSIEQPDPNGANASNPDETVSTTVVRETGDTVSSGNGGGQLPGFPENGGPSPSPNGQTRTRSRSRRSRQGPSVQIVSESNRPESGWIEADTVYINAAHPAYEKARRENQLRYHRRIVVLLALCREASVDPVARIDLLERALAGWGSGGQSR